MQTRMLILEMTGEITWKGSVVPTSAHTCAVLHLAEGNGGSGLEGEDATAPYSDWMGVQIK